MKVRNAIYIVAGIIGLSSCEDVSTPQFDPVKDAFVQSTVASRVLVGTESSVVAIPLELVALPSAQATVKFEFDNTAYNNKAELGKHFQLVDKDGNPIESQIVTFAADDLTNTASVYLKPLNAADNEGKTYQTNLVLVPESGCNLGAKHTVDVVVVYNQDLAPLLGSFSCLAACPALDAEATWTVQILPSGDDLNTLSIQNLMGSGSTELAVVGRLSNGNYNQISIDFGQELTSTHKFATTSTADGGATWTFSTVGRMVLSKSGNKLSASLSGLNFYCGAALDDDDKAASSSPFLNNFWTSLTLTKQ